MYVPLIKSAVPRKRYRFERHEAHFLERVVPAGSIEYEYIIVVFGDGAEQPLMFVTSEKNNPGANLEMLRELGIEQNELPSTEGQSHHLCLFDAQGHHNLGASDDWGDATKFEARALQLLTETLGSLPRVI